MPIRRKIFVSSLRKIIESEEEDNVSRLEDEEETNDEGNEQPSDEDEDDTDDGVLPDWPYHDVKELLTHILTYINEHKKRTNRKRVLRNVQKVLKQRGYDYREVAVANKWKSLVRAYKNAMRMHRYPHSPFAIGSLDLFMHCNRMEHLKRLLQNINYCSSRHNLDS